MGMTTPAVSSYTEQRTLFARQEHGGHPVRVHQAEKDLRFEVLWPSGPALYKSGRRLLRALYGETRAPNLTVDQYFRLSSAPVVMTPTVFDLFCERPLVANGLPLREQRESRGPRGPRRSRPARVPPQPTLTTLTMFAPKPPPLAVATARPRQVKAQLAVAADAPTLGINLFTRSHEVRKILFKGFTSLITRHNLDPDDMFQEISKGIIARNRGKCPFDPRKSSFGHYVHMVCACILSNAIRKKKRIEEHEQVGVYTPQGGDESHGFKIDAALAARSDRHGGMNTAPPDEALAATEALDNLLAIVGPKNSDIARKVIPLLLEGHTRQDLVKTFGREETARVMTALQAAGTQFAATLRAAGTLSMQFS